LYTLAKENAWVGILLPYIDKVHVIDLEGFQNCTSCCSGFHIAATFGKEYQITLEKAVNRIAQCGIWQLEINFLLYIF